MKDKKLMISFKGNKAEIHKQLKVLCAQSGEAMNDKVIELIEKYVTK